MRRENQQFSEFFPHLKHLTLRPPCKIFPLLSFSAGAFRLNNYQLKHSNVSHGVLGRSHAGSSRGQRGDVALSRLEPSKVSCELERGREKERVRLGSNLGGVYRKRSNRLASCLTSVGVAVRRLKAAVNISQWAALSSSKPCYQPPAIREGPKATKSRAKCHLSQVIMIPMVEPMANAIRYILQSTYFFLHYSTSRYYYFSSSSFSDTYLMLEHSLAHKGK